MSSPLIGTKFHIPPPRPDLVPRPHLLRTLDASLRRPQGLILVSAPAGFGKTTLIAEWLRHTGQPAAWFSLDREDNEPAQFWRCLIAALQTADPSCGRSLPSALDLPDLPPVDALVGALVNDLSARAEPLTLVLDDYHLIDNGAIHAGVNLLLDRMPASLCVVIATRADPPLALSRRRGRAAVTETRTADLRFSRRETAAFLNGVHQLGLADDDVIRLEERTEGWIVGLQLAALSLARQADRRGFVAAFAGDDRYVVDYLLEEVLNQQTPEMQAFLLQTSVLDRLCAPLCDAVTETTGAEARLHRMEEENLFIVPLDSKRRWYRYHTLFSDLLRRRLNRETTVDDRRALSRRASAWFEAKDLPAEAIAQALAIPDFDLAADLLERHVIPVFFRSETMLVHRWLQALPEEVVRARPLLCAMFANTNGHIGMNDPEALRTAAHWLDAAEAGAAGIPHASDRLRGLIGLTRAYLALWRCEPPQAIIPLAQQALDSLPKAGSSPAELDLLRFRSGLYNNIGLSQARLGNWDLAVDAFQRARAVGEICGDLLNVFAAVAMQADGLEQKGRLPEALALCRSALQTHAAENGGDIPYAGYVHLHAGSVLLEWNELEAAETALTRGVSLSLLLATAYVQIFGCLALVRLQAARGNFAAAFLTLDRLERRLPASASLVEAYRIRLKMKQGSWDAAFAWARGRGFSGELTESYTLARILLHAGREKRSSSGSLSALLAFLETSLAAAEAEGRIDRRIELLILRAQLADLEKNPSLAEDVLRRALALSEPGGYLRLYLDEGRSVLRLLAALEARGGDQAPYIRRILAMADADRAGKTASAAGLPEPLSAREMEILRLVAAGMANADIARRLVITLNTTKKHLTHIFGKLNASSRTDAVARARTLGLLS